jgi:hypothetical protein
MIQPPPTESDRGSLMIVPMRPERALTLESVRPVLVPWAAARTIGVQGRDAETNEPAIYLLHEWPAPSGPAEVGRTKEDMERLHLDQFCTDYLLAVRDLPYDDIERHSDPRIDFAVTDVATGERLGVDLTQCADPRQRHASALFGGVHDALLRRPRREFLGLAGSVIYMWFRDARGNPSLPPPRREAEEVGDAIATALAAYEVEPEATTTGPEPPERLPDFGLEETDFGCSFYAAPLRGAAPVSQLFAAMGFELALSFQAVTSLGDAVNTLRKLVADHDHEGVDHLLITAGAPDTRGATFVSEQLLLDFILSHVEASRLEPPEHVKRVTAYYWGKGRIVELYPSPGVVSARLYETYSPPHFAVNLPPIAVEVA